MPACRYAPAARDDLETIWAYSVERWGAAQAASYLRQLTTACDEVAAGTRPCRSVDDIRPGYWTFRAGAHVVFARWAEDGALDVIRILHQRMDVTRHL